MTQPNYSFKNLMTNLQRFGQTSATNRNKLQPHIDKTSKLQNQLDYFGSIKSPSVLDITVQLQCSDMGPIKMTRSTAHISHNRHNRRWCTFFELMNFLHTEGNILAHLEQFRLFCRVLTHFLVYFLGA